MNAATLSATLRSSTKALHVEAERSGLMGLLLRGRITRDDYARLLRALLEIYGALERGLHRHRHDALLGPLLRPAFERTAALSSDLEALETMGAPVPSVPDVARRYALHLEQLASEDPPRLLAHAWLRYLGDLNGGQIVGRIVRDSLELPLAATRFYEFPELADPHAAAAEWRMALDAAPLDADAQARIVAEAGEGFERHIALFRALAPVDQEAEDSSPAA